MHFFVLFYKLFAKNFFLKWPPNSTCYYLQMPRRHFKNGRQIVHVITCKCQGDIFKMNAKYYM